MSKNIYREKLKKFLMTECGLAEGSVMVYLAGTNDKKPSGDIRYKVEKSRLKHPFNEWGLAIRPFLKEKSQKAKK
ncbi:hypothetical protein [Campylobacter sp.]|uniref:hypothetical protein n=1 Tax=Campylobacter sp. TaxID=205 RepID=UPI00290B9A7E|nr:hypothetical protein [Campylobacter sp.]MDU6827778.1 hypothetical protein [Campylobacter sp.]